MKLGAASTFWQRHHGLPAQIQVLSFTTFVLRLANPLRPFILFQRFNGSFWPVKVGSRYRTIWLFRDGETFARTRIGTHEEYKKF